MAWKDYTRQRFLNGMERLRTTTLSEWHVILCAKNRTHPYGTGVAVQRLAHIDMGWEFVCTGVGQAQSIGVVIRTVATLSYCVCGRDLAVSRSDCWRCGWVHMPGECFRCEAVNSGRILGEIIDQVKTKFHGAQRRRGLLNRAQGSLNMHDRKQR